MVHLWQGPRRICLGSGAAARVGEEVAQLTGGKGPVAVIVDPGVHRSGVAEPVLQSLDRVGLKAEIFREVERNPSLATADRATAFVRAVGALAVVGVGGGSAMDVAKAAAAAAQGGSIRDWLGADRVPGPGLPLVLVPTTAGTGSEVSHAAVLHDEEVGYKRVAVSRHLLADVAVLDPLLTLDLPPVVTADSGMDALTHAVEAYTAVAASPLSDPLALEAIRLIGRHLRPAYAAGRNCPEAREGMLVAAALAGMAFTAAGLGAVHLLGYPLSEQYGLSHGRANAVLLPHVMRYNLVAAPHRFAAIAAALGEAVEQLGPRQAAATAVAAVEQLLADLDISPRLRDYGVPEEALDRLAEQALDQGARLVGNNARRLDLAGARAVLRSAW